MGNTRAVASRVRYPPTTTVPFRNDYWDCFRMPVSPKGHDRANGRQ